MEALDILVAKVHEQGDKLQEITNMLSLLLGADPVSKGPSADEAKLKGKEKQHLPVIAPSTTAPEILPNPAGRTFDAALYGRTLRDGFERLYNNSSALESDVLLVVGEERIPAHKTVLIAWSETFRSMLGNSAWRESGLSEVPVLLSEEDTPIFKHILKYMYTGETDFVSSENIIQILALSDYYAILPLKEFCGQLLGERVSEENIVYMLDIVDRYDCRQLNAKCGSFLAANFKSMLEEEPERLMALKPSTWSAMLDSDELQIPSEDQLFGAVLLFASQFEGRAKETTLTELLPHIRFPLLSGKFLIQTVEGNAELQGLEVLRHILFETYRYRIYPKGGTTLNATPRVGFQRFDSRTHLCSPTLAISDDGLTATVSGSAGGWANVRCLVPFSTASPYIEWKVGRTGSTNQFMLGVVTGTCPTSGYAGQYANGWTLYSNGQLYHAGTTPVSGSPFSPGDSVGVYLKPSEGVVKFYTNRSLNVTYDMGHRAERESKTHSSIYPIVCTSGTGDSIAIVPMATPPVDDS